MPQVVQITSENFEGQVALVTFYPCTGGTITIGYVTIPYNYEADYYLGTYTLYFPEYNETCDFIIPCPTPTPTPTKTATPTRTNPKLTPTRTPTKTATPTKTTACFCYNFINETQQDGKLKYYDCNNKYTQTIVQNSSTLPLCVSLSSFTASSYVTVVQSGPCNGGSCATPTPTPTITATQTKTPTVTPTQTKTPTNTVTKTKTQTPTKTPTPTKRPQSNDCDIFYVTKNNKIFSYDPSTNISIELTSFFTGESIINFNEDIAHTENTLWLLGNGVIQEWFIQISPFNALFSRYITLNFDNGDGLGAIDNTTLLIERNSDVPSIPNQIIKLDISLSTPNAEILFFLPNTDRYVTGDISYNSIGKILITNQDLSGNRFISQYDYNTTLLEVDIEIGGDINVPVGSYEYNNQLFIVDGNNGQNYSIENFYPYSISATTLIGQSIRGISQLVDCSNFSFRFTPLLSPTPTPSITPTNTNTPSITTTKTNTPSITPTRCCLNFDMYGGTLSEGSIFDVTYCDNTTSQIQVNQFTMYSTQYGSSLCGFNVIRLSGNGIVYTGSCGCINPTPTSTPTPTVTPSNLSECLDCGLDGIGYYSEQVPGTTPTPTPTNTPTVTKTPNATNTPTVTKTPNATNTPTNTNTSTLTPTNTNTPTSTKTNTITVIGSFNLSYNPFDISSDSASLRYYSYSQDGTEILDSEYKDVDSLNFSAYSGNTKAKVLFDPTNFKMYFGSLGNQFIDVYDIVGLSTSHIDLSSYNASAWDMTLDVNNGVLGIITGEQSPNGKIIFISTSTDTVYGQFTGTSGGYRGAITNDSSGYVATVSSTEDSIRTYNSTVPLTGTTIPISANTGGYRGVIHNQTNNYYYVLNFGNSLEWVDPSLGSLGSLSLTGYSGSNINSSMIYNPSNDRIYILNVKSNGNYGIITVDCLTNTILNFTDSLLIGGGTGAYEGGIYLDIITSPNELLLWTKTNKSVYRLSIP
jgi:hypothetical protein